MTIESFVACDAFESWTAATPWRIVANERVRPGLGHRHFFRHPQSHTSSDQA